MSLTQWWLNYAIQAHFKNPKRPICVKRCPLAKQVANSRCHTPARVVVELVSVQQGLCLPCLHSVYKTNVNIYHTSYLRLSLFPFSVLLVPSASRSLLQNTFNTLQDNIFLLNSISHIQNNKTTMEGTQQLWIDECHTEYDWNTQSAIW